MKILNSSFLGHCVWMIPIESPKSSVTNYSSSILLHELCLSLIIQWINYVYEYHEDSVSWTFSDFFCVPSEALDQIYEKGNGMSKCVRRFLWEILQNNVGINIGRKRKRNREREKEREINEKGVTIKYLKSYQGIL